MDALRRSCKAAGDLAAAPASAPAFFRPLRARFDALRAAPGLPGPGLKAFAAAEDFTLRLEQFFSGMALHGTRPDAAVMDVLAILQLARPVLPGLLGRRRDGALAGIHGACYRAAGVLRRAREASAAAPGDFPLNLKFSSMYSDLDAVFDAFARCAEALYGD
jgi:hypothetical protein